VKEAPAVFGHSTVYAGAAILNRAAGFLLIPLYTQFLSASDFGLLGVIAVTSEVVGAVIGVKLGTSMSRLFFDYAEEQERAELVSTAIIGLGTIVAVTSAVIAASAGPLGAIILGNRDHGVLLFVGIAGLLLNIIYTLGLQELILRERSRTVLILSTLRSVLYLSIGALFVAPLDLGVFGALLAILLTNALAVAWLMFPLLARTGIRFSRTKFLDMLGFGIPLLPGYMAELLIKFSDRYLLAHITSSAAAGVFFLGVRLTSILPMMLVAPFNQTYIVRRFEAHGRNAGDLDASRVFTYFFAILVSGALALSLVAPQLIALIAFRRPEYHGTAAVIPFLSLAEVIRSLQLIVELGIFYAKIPRYLTIASIGAALMHIPLTAMMIGIFGALGAAGAVVVSTAFRLILTWRFARGLNGPQPEWKNVFVILGAGVAVFGVAAVGDVAVGPASGTVGRVFLAIAFPLALVSSPVFSGAERQALRDFAVNRIRPRKHGSERKAAP
jgi:O-antigen/teichoic acid export membrane protein